VTPLSVSVPLVAWSVTWIDPDAESMSVIEIRLPLPLENERVPSSLTLCAAGTLFVGPSLTD
jgi:hypothetical protein